MITLDAVTSMDGLTGAFTQFMTWIKEMLTAISAEPLLMIGIAIFVAGAVIGLAYRALHGRG